MEVGGIDDLLIDRLKIFVGSSQEALYIGEGKIGSHLCFYVKAKKSTAKKFNWGYVALVGGKHYLG